MNSEIPPMKKLGYLHNEVSFTSFDENRFLFFPLMYSEDQIKIVTTVLNQNNFTASTFYPQTKGPSVACTR